MAVRLEHDSEDLGSTPDSDDPLRSDDAAGTAWGRSERKPAAAPRGGGVDGLFGRAAGPAPAPAGEADDPIASLFQGGRAVPAPAIPEAPSESELKRWNATVRSSSLFDESVVDPAPSASSAASGARTRARPAAPVVSTPEVRAVPASAVGRTPAPIETHEPEFDAPMPQADEFAPVAPAPAPRKTAQMIAAPPPAAAAPPPPAALAPASPRKAKKDRASGRSGTRNKRADGFAEGNDVPGTEEARNAAVAPVEMRRKRIARGPNKIMLAAVGFAALLSIGTAAAVIGLIPSPIPLGFAGDPNATASEVEKPKPAAKPAATAPAAKPVNAAPAAPVAAAPAAKSAPAAAPHAAIAAAPAAKPSKAEAPAAASAAPAPVAAAPAPKPVAPAAAAGAEADVSATSADADRLILAANKKLAADDAAGAEALMRQGLARDPDDHHMMEVLVRALIEQDRGTEAVPLARKMVKKRGKRVPYRLLLGDALLMTGDQAGARAEWQAAYELDPKDRQVRMRLGN